MIRICTTTFFLLYSLISLCQVNVDSRITSDQVWTADKSPYIISSNTVVEKGVHIEIRPGTIVYSSDAIHQFFIHGELKALGKMDSVIVFDNMKLHFDREAIGFDSAKQTGSQFDHCLFTSNRNPSIDAIRLEGVSISVKNTEFIDVNNGIYGESYPSTAHIYLENVAFLGKQTSNTSPVNILGAYYHLSMKNCYMEHVGKLNVGKSANIRNCSYVNGALHGPVITISRPKNLTLTCNLFSNLRNSVFNISYLDPNSRILVEDNRFEKLPGVMTLWISTGYDPNKFTVSGNSFIDVTTLSTIDLKGTAGTSKLDTFNFRGNYWNTQNPTYISNAIIDHNDDITRSGIVDFSNYLTAPNTDCTSGDRIGSSGFSSTPKIQQLPIAVFPNPTEGLVHVSVEDSKISLIRLYDLTGKLILEEDVYEYATDLDLTSVQNGVYFLFVTGEGFLGRSKLVVTK